MDALNTIWSTFFDFDAMREALPELLTVGLPNTLILAVSSGILGTVLGMLLAVAGLSRHRWLRWPARVYTDVLRGLPAVVTILLIGVGFAPFGMIVWGPNPYPFGILALGLIASAYIGEIFRSGIQSVDKGQTEAARAIGFSGSAAMRLVVIPQGVRRVLPALVNQFIALIKDSSLIYFLGLLANQRELFRIGQDAAANTGNRRRSCSRALLPGHHGPADPRRERDRQAPARRPPGGRGRSRRRRLRRRRSPENEEKAPMSTETAAPAQATA